QTTDINSPSGVQVTINKSKAMSHQVSTARTLYTIRNRSGGRHALDILSLPLLLEIKGDALVRTRWKTPHLVYEN
ncbi:hypothetical protein HD554DRAFT_2020492, partial [Boletus coccyginus]